MNLTDLRDRIHAVNTANGWFDRDRSEGEGFALIHTEAAEATEAYRRWGTKDVTADLCEHEAPSATGEHLCKPEGVGSELADVAIRVLDQAYRDEVLIEWPDDLGDSMLPDGPMTTASFGDWMDKLHTSIAGHSLQEILVMVARIAEAFEIDLSFEVERKLAFNATRGHRHGGKLL